MAKHQAPESPETPEAPKPEKTGPIDVIAANVLKSLGRPKDLDRVVVICTNPQSGSYRVNVAVATTDHRDTCVVKSIRIAHSYHVHANSAGGIIRSDPAIERVYG